MSIKGPDNDMRRRLSFLTIILCGICVAGVAFKLFHMQVIDHDHWTAKASDFQTEDDIIQPARGTIYDTNMNELAVSAGSELIYIDPSSVINQANTDNGYTEEQQQARMAELLDNKLSDDDEDILDDIGLDMSEIVRTMTEKARELERGSDDTATERTDI